jgi:predicted metal-dependent HD superfamily phosphohydrolase
MMTGERFQALWARNIAPDTTGEVWARLDAGYRDPARAYHGWAHIEAMLAGLESVRGLDEFSDARFDLVELAIFFHDAVYETRRKDNEARSAEFFRVSAGEGNGIGEVGRAHVVEMIVATASHRPSVDISTRLLLDLDLAILGSDPLHYSAYVDAVRREYAAVPEDAWRHGRAAVLKRFLERERIYQTAHFGARLEAQARANIAAEIARLAAAA